LGTLGKEEWLDDLGMEILLIEGDGRINLNIHPLMYLSQRYGSLLVDSCDLEDSRWDIGIVVGSDLSNHLPPSFH